MQHAFTCLVAAPFEHHQIFCGFCSSARTCVASPILNILHVCDSKLSFFHLKKLSNQDEKLMSFNSSGTTFPYKEGVQEVRLWI